MRKLELLSVLLVCVCGCAGGAASGRTSMRPRGCPVEVLEAAPAARPVRAIGHVIAHCRGLAATDENWCRRELMDQACAIGGEVLWELASTPTEEGRDLRATVGVYR